MVTLLNCYNYFKNFNYFKLQTKTHISHFIVVKYYLYLWCYFTCRHISYMHYINVMCPLRYWAIVNPLYTDVRYNDKIRYNDNLKVTKPSLKRWQLMRNARICIKASSSIYFGYLLESHHWGDSNKYSKHMFYEEIRIKQGFSYISLCPLRILCNSKFTLMTTGNKCYRCNEGSL